ncbi:MAG: aminotransferase DegT [Euryarchaeota archaeon]|nr:aminotransferase DegT [Euryarchaeota archaeon]
MEFVDLKSQYQALKKDVDQRVLAVLEHGQYINGPEVDDLENALADFVGVKHCVAVSSGTDALLIAMMALGVEPGDEVITTPFSFISTAETIALLGAKPVFVDIDERTCNIDPLLIEPAITSRTKAIMPVSLYGQCADMDTINSIAAEYKISVIEDAAQSFGATYKGKRSGGLSPIGCTSFFPSKPLGCYGDGGACFTNDPQLAERMKSISLHGQTERYHHTTLGVNGRLDTIQAAVLLAKLKKFNEEIECRIRCGERYSKFIDSLSESVTTPFIDPMNTSVFAQYTIQADKRDSLRDFMASQDIPTAVHYPRPLHKQPVFAELVSSGLRLPISERVASRVLSLPVHAYLSESEQDSVIYTLNSFYK